MVVERKFIKGRIREYKIKEFMENYFKSVGFSHIDIKKTPVGYSITIYSSKPGLIVGKRGSNIAEIQDILQKEFKLESPVVDVQEITHPDLDPNIVAENISSQIKKFGTTKFKAIGHKAVERMISSGAAGAEVRISGLVPSTRAKAWKFNAGNLPKCGDVAQTEVLVGKRQALTKRGMIGITVKLLPPGVLMPDRVDFKEIKATISKETIKNKETPKVEVKVEIVEENATVQKGDTPEALDGSEEVLVSEVEETELVEEKEE